MVLVLGVEAYHSFVIEDAQERSICKSTLGGVLNEGTCCGAHGRRKFDVVQEDFGAWFQHAVRMHEHGRVRHRGG